MALLMPCHRGSHLARLMFRSFSSLCAEKGAWCWLATVALLTSVSPVSSAPLTAGNLVVYRVGTGTGSLVNTGNPVFLDEYTPAGVLVQSIALPTTVNGPQKRLVASGTATSDGLLSRSADGRYVVLTGYDSPLPGAGSLTGSASASVNRVIGRMDGSGFVDTTTALTDANDANNFRGVCSNDGSQFWTAGSGTGLRYAASLGATTSLQISTTNTNVRQPLIAGGQLYISSGNGSTVRLGTVGTGLPAASGQVMATLPGYPTGTVSPNAFVLLDLDSGVAGADTLYTADDNGTVGGLLKYSFNGSTWTARGAVGVAADAYRGLTASVAGSTVTLYAVRKGGSGAVGGGELVGVVDATGSTGTLVGTPALLATAAPSTAMRGVAFTPITDLSVEVTGPGEVVAPAALTYTIAVSNLGAARAADVAVRFTLPAGVEFVSATGGDFTASHSAGVVAFTGGTIAPLASQNLTVITQPLAVGTITLLAGSAVVDPLDLQRETSEVNNASTNELITEVVNGPDLRVSLAAPATAAQGAEFDLVFTLTNDGLAGTTAADVMVNLPVALEYVSSTATGFNRQGTYFSQGELDAGESATITIKVKAIASGPVDLTGIAEADPNEALSEGNESNNLSGAASISIYNPSDLTLSLTHQADFQAGAGGALTATVANVGTGDTQGEVFVSGDLPDGLTVGYVVGTDWQQVQGAPHVIFKRAQPLQPGQSYPALVFGVAVPLNAPASVVITLRVSGGGELNGSNNNTTDVATVIDGGPGRLSWELPPSAAGLPFYAVNEDAGFVTVRILRTQGRHGAVSVTAGAVGGSAVAPDDFGLVNQTITFADGEVEKTLLIPIRRDTIAEALEQFQLVLSSPAGGAVLGNTPAVTVAIADSDHTKPVLTVRTPAQNARLGAGSPALNVEVKGRVTDNSGLAMHLKTQASLNNGPFVAAAAIAPGSPEGDNYAVSPGQAQPGLNSLRVRATDLRGNTTELLRSFVYDSSGTPQTYPLNLQVSPPAAGDVAITPAASFGTLGFGKTFTLKATPAPGKRWKGWISPQLALTPGQSASPSLTFAMSQGLSITAQFIDEPFIPQVAGMFNGLVTAMGAAVPGNDTSGFISLKVELNGVLTGSLKIDGKTWPLAGAVDPFTGAIAFDAERTSTKVLLRDHGPAYILALNMDLSNQPSATHRITGTLGRMESQGVMPMSAVGADRAFFDGRTPGTTAPLGKYTVALPARPQISGLPASAFPQGAGIGEIKITPTGLATLKAVLADGTAFTAAVPMSKALTMPLFAQLYPGKGGSFGCLATVDASATDTDVSSPSCFWFKPWTGGQHYPFGWPGGVFLPLIGARFTQVPDESVLPDLGTVSGANAKLVLSLGGLVGAVEKEVMVSPSNGVTKVPASDVSYDLSLVAASGRINGTFTHTDGTKPAFTGVILQKGANRRAFGYFLTTAPKTPNGAGQSGDVKLVTKYNPRPTLVISEFMAKNVSTIVDEDGAYSDWIEIYNPGSEPVNLLDWCLTDNASNLTKWRFPDVELGARRFLLVWASNKNRATPGQPLHTNFALSNDGEYLALVRPDGVTIEHQFAPAFPALADDESYGVNFSGVQLVVKGSTARYLVPPNGSLGTSWTSRTFGDGSWTSGRTGLGFGVSVPGFKVRQVAAAGTFPFIDSVAEADALLALPPGHADIASETTVISQTLNFLGEGDDGHYDGNTVPPNGLPSPYVIKATGNIIIQATGSYVFGLNSDDGGRIRIDGVTVMLDDTNHGPQDHLGAPVTLTAGSHSVEVIMWEGFGGDELEFFAAPGTSAVWTSDFKLVGSPGGLVVSTPPLGASSGTGNEVATNLQSKVQGKSSSCYVRVPFTAAGVSTFSALTLSMRYNDGFIAYLNGVEIARRNAPASAAFNSAATAARSNEATLIAETIDVTSGLSALVSGSNVLAIHGMNIGVGDDSFLVLPELSAMAGLAGDPVYFTPGGTGPTATPQAVNGTPAFLGEVADTKFSVDRGFFSAPFSLAITSATPGATIRYTLDGSPPGPAHGTVYSGPLKIARTSIVRAMAYKTGFRSTDVDTRSFFFLDDVIRQSANGQRPGAGWPAGTLNGQVADYGMDPQIVNSTNPEIGGATKVKQALMAIPTMSLVTDLPNLFDQANGIWVNPSARGFEWERPASLELIGDSNTSAGGFQANCGIRVRGGFSRSGDNPKHGFHVYFRTAYGDAKLNYPLFGNEGASSFDQIDLRTAQNYSWSFGGDGSNTFLREEVTRELQGAMGQPYGRGRYYHLYINGQYWGLYDTEERTEADYSETYLGGDKDDYDVVKGEQDQGYTTGVTDGNIDAWRNLWDQSRAHASDPTNTRYFAMQGKAADGLTPTADPVLLDVDNLIDYMLLTFWTGNLDGCTSAFLGDARANNWFGSRDRTGSKGFVFFAHDFEHTFFNVNEDRTGPFNPPSASDFAYSNPMFLHHDLRPNLEYRVRWGDRVQKHMFGSGVLTAANVQMRLLTRAALVDKVIMAESARWGDSKVTSPLTRLNWQSARDYVINDYVPNRGGPVLQQLRADGLYPSFDAPELSQHGGEAASGQEIIITGHGGTLYYTLNGSDPRQLGGAVHPSSQIYTSSISTESLIPVGQVWKYLADGSDQSAVWRMAGFDDSAWVSGLAELGYGDGDEATTVPFVDADPGAAGVQKNATTYFRSSFTVASVAGITAASIALKVDDAAAVYINGVEALRTSNLPVNAAYNQYASSGTPDENATVTYSIDPALLVSGVNIIAAEVHQADAGSTDISFQLKLDVVRTETPTPLYLTGTGARELKVRALNNGEWSALVDATFNVRQASDLRVTNVANGAFTTGGTGSFAWIVTNQGTAATSGLVTVSGTLPPGLVATSLSGAGWSVQQNTGSVVAATRSDALAAGQSYPALTLNVGIAAAAPAFVTTTTVVSGGGEITTSNNTFTLVTPVAGAGASQLLFGAASYTVNEEGGSVPVTILRTGSRSGSAAVVLSSIKGTAQSPGDYDAVSQTVTFADSEASQTVNVVIRGDEVKEPDETFTLALGNVTGNASLGATAQATIRILEADSTAPKISISTPTAAARVVAADLMIKGSATDNKGVARVQMKLGNGSFADVPLTSNAAGTSASFTVMLRPSPGNGQVTVRAYDWRGNVSDEVTRTFIYVPLRPLALTVAPASGGVVTINPQAALTSLEVGKVYTLKAVPKQNFVWSHWSGPGINSEAESLTFTMTEGLAITASFADNPYASALKGSYQGLVVAASAVAPGHDNHGFIQVKVTDAGAFTGTVTSGGAAFPCAGVLNPAGLARFGVERKPSGLLPRQGRPGLVLALAINLTTAQITGTLGVDDRTGVLPLSALSMTRVAAPLPASSPYLANGGKYDVTMPAKTQTNGLALADFPQASSTGVITLAKSGAMTFVGALSDGTRLTASGLLSEGLKVPFYAPLYAGQSGAIQALITLDDNAVGSDLTASDVIWFRPATPTATGPFPSGWPQGLVLDLTGVRQ